MEVADPYKYVEFTVTELDLENGYDFLYIATHTEEVIVTLTGTKIPSQKFMVSSPGAFVYFDTDASTTAKGFTLSFIALLGLFY